jgi:hypothetical protein
MLPPHQRVKGVLPPRREVFNPARPSSFGTYMKMLAPFSSKYYRPQCKFLAGISAVRAAIKYIAASTARGHLIRGPDECLYQTPVDEGCWCP